MYMSVLSPIEVPKGKRVLRILNNSGDKTIVYDPTVEAERIAAEAAFTEELPKRPRIVTMDGSGGGTVIKDFAESQEETIITPQYVGG